MLTELPSELLNIIVSQIVYRSDLKHLCEVCKRLYHVTIPYLYKSLILSTTKLGLVTAMENIPWEYLKYTRELGFRVPIRNRYDDFESVAKYIANHGYQLQSLALDVVHRHRPERIWADEFSQRMPDNSFAQTVLNVQPGVQRESLPSLHYLNLSGVSFHHMGMEMICALNVERLRSLKLYNCPGTFDWLQLIVDSEKAMNLKLFELTFKPGCTTLFWGNVMDRITETLSCFIRRLRGLEDLFVMLPHPVDWSIVADGILSHSHSLGRVVTHNLAVDIDGEVPWTLPFEKILEGRRLHCFGTSLLPRELLSHWRHMSPRPVCKLIHLRTSGVILDGLDGFDKSTSPVFGTSVLGRRQCQTSDEYTFAQWAFSADGLPTLQVLALGDFSFEGPYSEYNVLLCRSDGGYQRLSRADVQAWDLVQNNMDMLAACPYDPLLD
jgi:hypothetical protein